MRTLTPFEWHTIATALESRAHNVSKSAPDFACRLRGLREDALAWKAHEEQRALVNATDEHGTTVPIDGKRRSS